MAILKRLRQFIVTIFIGGIGVIFPLVVLFIFFNWLYRIVSNFITPFAEQLHEWLSIPVSISSIILIALIFVGCFFIGLIVRTKTGTFLYSRFEKHLLSRIPGYRLIREAAQPFFKTERNFPLTRPALVRPYGADTQMVAFVTDYHEKSESYSAFIPTSPNPTSGIVFILKKDRVQFLDTSFEKTMRSIVAGGSGSSELIDAIIEHKDRQ